MSVSVPVIVDKEIHMVCGKDKSLIAYPGSCIAYNSFKDVVDVGVLMHPPNNQGLYPVWGGAVLHWIKPEDILYLLMD